MVKVRLLMWLQTSCQAVCESNMLDPLQTVRSITFYLLFLHQLFIFTLHQVEQVHFLRLRPAGLTQAHLSKT